MKSFLAFIFTWIFATACFAAAAPPVTPGDLLYTPPNGAISTLQAELNRLHGLNQMRAVMTRSGLGPAAVPSVTDNAQALVTYRHVFQVGGAGGTSSIQVRYCNIYYGSASLANVNGAGEVKNSNPITVTAGVWLNTNPAIRAWVWNNANQYLASIVTWNNGQTAITIPGGSCAWSDTIPLQTIPGQEVAIQSTCYEPVAHICPASWVGGEEGNGNWDGLNEGLYAYTLTGNGTTGPYTFTAPASYLPVIPRTFFGNGPGGSCVTTDNGAGVITPGCGIASGTINYTTGAVSLTFSTAAPTGSIYYPQFVGGGTSDQSTITMTNFSNCNSTHLCFGPQAIVGTSLSGTSMPALAIAGDSIMNGSGNSMSNVSWVDYSIAGRYGVVKGAMSGEELLDWALPAGRAARMRYMGGPVASRVIANYWTNDGNSGRSLSQSVNDFIAAAHSLAALTTEMSGSAVWWVSALPRTNSSNVAIVPLSGPYTAAGALYGAAAVASPTPLGGAYGSGVIGHGILSCTITGTGSVGPYSCNFGEATMIGSLWSDAAYSTVVDTGAGGASATTLTGNLVSTGTHTPATGGVALTFSSALSSGQTVNLFAYANGPSARNAWNYFLYNWALPTGLIGGVVDLAACLESSPASAMGAGNGQWLTPMTTYSAEPGTHPSPTAHQTIIPGCLGPTGTNPSPVWSLQ